MYKRQPFTLIAKVTPEFTAEGLYNAADLFVYSCDSLWQKLAFEQDEYGNHLSLIHISLAADLYEPKDAKGALAAIAVSGPFGAVKEQSS